MDLARTPRSRRSRAATFASLATGLALLIAPGGAFAADPGYNTTQPDYVALQPGVTGDVIPLVNSGEEIFGDIFEGIPDGIGAVPGPGNQGWVDLYVAHEQSHVPFQNFADYQDSSVSRVRVDVASQSVTDLEVVLSPELGFIRFCSAFMAGPDEGFAKYTFFLNEESNDLLEVPAGAPYGSDPSVAPLRQAGYAVAYDVATGKVHTLASAGRHNHENMVVVPGWSKGIVALSGDDTFTFPSTAARPNLSQLYLSRAHNANHFIKDDSTLWAFRVTATHSGPVDPTDPFNDANDYLEIGVGQTWKGEFIPVPEDVARGDTADKPQDALEDWSNANNVFQFVRVEDIAYDPDAPRTVYFADTGNSRLLEDAGTGRLFRAPSGTPGTSASNGRVFKLVMNAQDPTKVDAFSIVVDGAAIGMRSPDNLDVGHHSLMVQEDAGNAKIWRMDLGSGAWTHVATATQPTAETSGIADVSEWFGDGWWAVTVQSHVNQSQTTGRPFAWDGPPGPEIGHPYDKRREDGQLLLLHVAGS